MAVSWDHLLTRRSLRRGLLLALACLHLGVLGWWLARDGVPDGHHNEYIHLYQSVEAWFRLRAGDTAGLRVLLLEEYFPPVLQLTGVVGLALLRLFGLTGTEDTLAAMNLVWLAVLVGSTYDVARRLASARSPDVARNSALWAAATAAGLPAIVGQLPHFEPNLITPATLTLAVAAVLRLEERGRVRDVVAAGLALGLAALGDRLTNAPFLLGLVGMAAWRGQRRGALAAACALAGLLAGPWYGEFAVRHLSDVLGQVGGEITAAGEQTEQRSYTQLSMWLHYPLALLDNQLGPLAGFGLLALWLWPHRVGSGPLARPARPLSRGDRPRSLARATVLATLLVGGLSYTLVLKKQTYYTQPALPLLVAWVAPRLGLSRRRMRAGWALAALLPLACLLAAHPEAPGWVRWPAAGPVVPLSVLERRYPQVEPPDGVRHGLGAVARALGEAGCAQGSTLLVGDTQVLYEGYLLSMLRLRLDTLEVEGALIAGEAFSERAGHARCLVYAIEGGHEQPWPERTRLETRFAQWHRAEELPRVWRALEQIRPRAVGFARLREQDRAIYLYRLD